HNVDFLRHPDNLRSSLAYKLFKHLVQNDVNVRMNARLGEVRTQENTELKRHNLENAGHILTQTEDGVLAGLMERDKHDALKAAGAGLDESERGVLRFLAPLGRAGDSELENEYAKGKKELKVAYVGALKELKDVMERKQGQAAKSGKLIYEFPQNRLKITFK